MILVTLVGQGLTLPWLINRLGVREDGAEEEAEEVRARLVASHAALERLDELAVEEWTLDDTIERVRGMYEFRQRRFKVRAGKLDDEDGIGIEDRSLAYQRLMHEMYAVQRRALVELSAKKAIDFSRSTCARVSFTVPCEITNVLPKATPSSKPSDA